VIEALTGSGYRVVAPDQIGWGKSPKPDIHYSFQLLAANTAALLDHLGVGKVAVLGHSTGGMTAVRFTLMHPDRVTQLVLEDPLGLADYRIGIPPQSEETLYAHEVNRTDRPSFGPTSLDTSSIPTQGVRAVGRRLGAGHLEPGLPAVGWCGGTQLPDDLPAARPT
jgi:pimeloyl-ACP methyl ester carboxylesterase